MKTVKPKTAPRSKKPSDTGKVTRKTKVTATKVLPTEEEIREKAREIYYERIARGEHGSPESDWREAEELLKGS